MALALSPAIEPDVIRAETGGEAPGEEEFAVEARNFEEQTAGALVPIQREVAVDFAHSSSAAFDGRSRCGGGSGASAAPARLG